MRKELSSLLIQRPYASLSEEAPTANRPGIYLSQSGWQSLPSGSKVFVAGDKIIGEANGDFLIDQAIAQIRLHTIQGPQKSLIQRFLQILMLEPMIYPAVWGFSLTTAMLSMITQANIDFQAIAYFVGKYAAGKSTIAKWLISLYDTTAKPERIALIYDLGSSTPALREVISRYNDLPVVVDDHCTSGDAAIVKGRKQTVAKFLRFVTNRTPQRKGVNQNSEELCAATLLAITAELGLDSESEWSRIIPFPIPNERKFLPMETRELAGVALQGFLGWVAPQYDKLLSHLCKEHQECLTATSSDNPRPNTTLFVTNWISHCFCQFCEESGILTPEEASGCYKSFENALASSIQYQQKRIRVLSSRKPRYSIEQIILREITSGSLPICDKRKHLLESAGLESDGRIYLWPNVVLSWVTKQTGYEDYTKIKISKVLKKSGVLIQEYGDASDNTVHLDIDGERHRFLCLDLKILQKVASQAETSG